MSFSRDYNIPLVHIFNHQGAKNIIYSNIEIINKLIKDPIQLGFLIFATFSTLLCIPFTYYGCMYVNKINLAKPKDYEFPLVSDFGICIILAAVYTIYIQGLAIPLENLFKSCAKGQNNKAEHDLRCKKSGDHLAKFIYKLFSSAFGFYILKDTEYFPSFLGGSGDISLLFKDNPYPKHVFFLKEYYISCMSYHLGQLFHTIIGEKKTDFAEMMLHHSVTIYLMLGSYMFNVWECGAIITFIHDFSDITAHNAKLWGNTTLNTIAIPSVIMVALNWFYCRCLVLPYCVYSYYVTGRAQNLFDSLGLFLFYIYLLSCLVALHYYWFGILVTIIINALFHNKHDDISERVEVQKKKE